MIRSEAQRRHPVFINSKPMPNQVVAKNTKKADQKKTGTQQVVWYDEIVRFDAFFGYIVGLQ